MSDSETTEGGSDGAAWGPGASGAIVDAADPQPAARPPGRRALSERPMSDPVVADETTGSTGSSRPGAAVRRWSRRPPWGALLAPESDTADARTAEADGTGVNGASALAGEELSPTISDRSVEVGGDRDAAESEVDLGSPNNGADHAGADHGGAAVPADLGSTNGGPTVDSDGLAAAGWGSDGPSALPPEGAGEVPADANDTQVASFTPDRRPGEAQAGDAQAASGTQRGVAARGDTDHVGTDAFRMGGTAMGGGTTATSTLSPPVTPLGPQPRRRLVAPEPSGPQVPTEGQRPESRTPDWMARRIVESQAPGAAYELGRERRWRRRKVTVLRTRANRRLIRRIDTWTVFKVSFLFYLLMVIIVLIAGVVSWSVAQHLGFVSDIQKSVRSLADDKSFILEGKVAFRYAAAGLAVLGLLGTLFNTVAAMLYNLLSDLVGGLQVIVVTEPD